MRRRRSRTVPARRRPGWREQVEHRCLPVNPWVRHFARTRTLPYAPPVSNSRRFRRRLALLVAATLPGVTSVTQATATQQTRPALPSNLSGCASRSVSWTVDPSSNFTSTEVAEFGTGMSSWNSYKDRAGSNIFSSTQGGAGTPVVWVRKPPGSGYWTDCLSDGSMRIRMADERGSAFYAHARFHEPGHTHLGLAHDGGTDNLTDGGFSEPLMRGCWGTPTAQTPDDWARASFRWDSSITPNSGFENAGIWFGSYNRLPYGFGGGGTYDAQVAANSTISRSTRVTPQLPSGYRLRAAYKHNSANPGAFKMDYRSVDYPTGSTCGGPYYPDNIDWNNPTVGAWVVGLAL